MHADTKAWLRQNCPQRWSFTTTNDGPTLVGLDHLVVCAELFTRVCPYLQNARLTSLLNSMHQLVGDL
jgi:hypothetical protein